MLERVEPLTFVLVAVLPDVHSEARDLVVLPLADIRVTQWTLPDTKAVLAALIPFSLVDLSIFPKVYSFAMSVIVKESPFVLVSTFVYFEALSTPFIR